ncbi:putative Ig domain-containing protein, partial [Rheinheimera baltica]
MLWITSSRARKIKSARQKNAMLSWRALLFSAALAMVSPTSYAATPSDQNFNGLVLGNQGSNSVTINGITYTNNAPNNIFIVNDGDLAAGADFGLGYRTSGVNASTLVSFKTSDGDEFKLNSFAVSTGLGNTTNLTIKGFRDNVEQISTNYDLSGVFFGTFDVSGNANWENIDEVRISGVDLDIDLDDIDFSPKVLPAPTITTATYNASVGTLVVTGTNFSATAGAINDVDANKFTLTGEGGATYTLTDTADVEISSSTSFTLSLSANDRAGVNVIANKNGSSSTGGTSYNLGGAAGFIADAPVTADLTSNGITVSNVPLPTISNATYDASTGVLTAAGSGFTKRAGAINDIVANKFTLYGEGGNSYTLTDTSNAEITSGTSFTLTLSATDKAAYNLIANKNGGTSTDISTYYLDAADDWAAGANAALDVEDSSGNNITVSNVAIPTITSAAYNFSTGVLVVTGSGYLSSTGATNDVVADKFTLTGEAGGTYTLTDTANVEVGSGISFTMTLSATDKTAVNSLLNNNGTSSQDSTIYNLAAADDWAAGANAALNVADLAGNGITASNVVTIPGAPTIGTATAGDTQASVTFTAPADNGGSAITSYTATAFPGGANASGAASPITVTGLTNGVAYTFTVTATNGVGIGASSAASNSVTPKAVQTITFANPGSQNFGTTPTLSATSDSGLMPTFSSTTTGVCNITSGGSLTFLTSGTCSIDADQPGSSTFLPATTVSRSFSVTAVVPGAPSAANATAGDTEATVSFTAPAFAGGAAITGYTVTSSPGTFTGTGAGSPILVTGLTNGAAYTFTVTATNSAGTGAASAASNSITPAATQVITFNNPVDQNFGTSPTLSATATSGLTPTFSSSTTGVCTITSGGVLTFVTIGTCTIDANQTGDSSYSAAPTVSRSFSVNAVVPAAPTSATATAGDTQASVAFIAPAFNGGAAITSYTVTSSPGALTGTGASSPIAVTGLTNGVNYTFTVTASNSAGTSAASVATAGVIPNGAPTIGGVPATSVNQGDAYSFTPTAADSPGDTLTFSIVNKPTWATFDTNDGTLSGTPTNADVGVTSGITISVSDGSLVASLTAFDLTVINVNDAPTITVTPPLSINQGVFYDYTPVAADIDPGTTLTFDAVNLPGWLTVDTSTGRIYGTPQQDDVGVYPFDIFIRVSDGIAQVWSDAFVITVVNVNDAPTIAGTAATSVAQDAAYSFTPSANDIDTSDTLTFSISNKPTWATFNTSSGELTGTPTNADVGTTTGVVISVSDGALSAALPAFNIEVTNVNDAPTITGTPAVTVAQNSIYNFTPSANDVDIGDSLTFSISNKPTWATFNTSSGELTGTPANADVGTTTGIVISVSDGNLSAALPGFNLEVTDVNDAPTISGTPATRISQDNTYSFIPTAVDVDGDDLTFSITNKPSWAAFDTASGALTGTPTNADVGITTNIVISVSDADLTASLPAFTIEVDNTNDAPVISGAPATTVAQDAIYSFTPTASDPDDDSLTFSIVNKPSWVTFDTATGSMTGTPSDDNVGTTTAISISVSDGEFSASLPAFDLTVTNVNDAPVIGGTPGTAVAQETAYSFVPTATDADDDTLTFSITNKPTWAAFNTTTGALTGTPVAADVGTTTGIVISVSDGSLSAALPAFNLEVTSVNSAPVISGTPTTSVVKDTAYSFVPTATDADDDTLTFSITNKPTWAAFNTTTGALTGTPVAADVGTTTGIVISVSDGS